MQQAVMDGFDGFFAQLSQKYVSDRTHSVVAMNSNLKYKNYISF
jgi:hypothetical protein